MSRWSESPASPARLLPVLLCAAVLVLHLLFIDLKGISSDEGIRLGIINGGRAYTPEPPEPWPNYAEVLMTLSPHAYQPAYYLLQNTLMRIAETQDLVFFRQVNVVFLGVCLAGLLVLSRRWHLWPRLFLLGLFAFNAYLIMHVLQIREYIVAVAFYIWSTWLVWRLDRHEFGHEWRDIAWFLGYGLLLTFGFYLQTWIVFPAIGQGVFLVLRQRRQLARFLAHLGLSYLVVFTLTWPYLRSNLQKVNVGLWETEQVTLLERLSHGFHLVLSGHLANHDRFTSLLPWFWLAVVVAALWLVWRRRPALAPELLSECSRQAWLMELCIALPLAFQIAYFYRVEALSVWPRYFIIHYFFATWLIATGFRLLHAASADASWRRPLQAGLVAATAMLAVSAVYQVRSYHRDPYFDTSMTAETDWRRVARSLFLQLRDDDVVFAPDFVTRSALTASQPLPHRTLMLSELEQADLREARRLVYLEFTTFSAQREDLVRRMSARGFSTWEDTPLPAADGRGAVPYWRVLTFARP